MSIAAYSRGNHAKKNAIQTSVASWQQTTRFRARNSCRKKTRSSDRETAANKPDNAAAAARTKSSSCTANAETISRQADADFFIAVSF